MAEAEGPPEAAEGAEGDGAAAQVGGAADPPPPLVDVLRASNATGYAHVTFGGHSNAQPGKRRLQANRVQMGELRHWHPYSCSISEGAPPAEVRLPPPFACPHTLLMVLCCCTCIADCQFLARSGEDTV